MASRAFAIADEILLGAVPDERYKTFRALQLLGELSPIVRAQLSLFHDDRIKSIDALMVAIIEAQYERITNLEGRR